MQNLNWLCHVLWVRCQRRLDVAYQIGRNQELLAMHPDSYHSKDLIDDDVSVTDKKKQDTNLLDCAARSRGRSAV